MEHRLTELRKLHDEAMDDGFYSLAHSYVVEINDLKLLINEVKKNQ